jgi:hypothetical protein
LDAIERAIRSAFEKGDAEDRSFRERVYRKAFAALDRGIMASKGLTVEAAMNRRKALQAKIAEIESEFIPAVAVDDDGAPVAPVAPPPVEHIEPSAVEPASVTYEAPPLAAQPDASLGFAPTHEGGLSAPAIDPGFAPTPDIGVGSSQEPVFSDGPSFGPGPAIGSEPAFDAAPTLLDIEAVGLDPHAQGRGHVEPDGSLAPEASLASAMRIEAVDERARKRRRPLAIAFIAATFIALVAIGGWWASQTGLFLTQAERDTSVPNPPITTQPEDFIPEAEEPPVLSSAPDPQRNWVFIFTPADATNLTAPADATAEAKQDESGSFLRVRSGPSGSAVIFDVGQGVLDQLAGKAATFDVVARAADGKQTQMAVLCSFGELGDCGRKRYAVGYERADYLFEVTFPAKQAGAGGTIAINSDFANTGNAVDIYEIKVSVAQ